MASKSGAVWAVDIGNYSLKALRLSAESGVVEVIGFDNIQHGKILTGSGVKTAERDELIALSLRQFVSRNDLGKDDIIVSVPSRNSFARFVNLPPVDPKRIPEIVKFEAVQQIPFDINDVQWDWQLMTETGGPETKVGIFAIKSDTVSSVLEHFSRENVTVNYVQMAPMALYNYALYEHLFPAGEKEGQATVILNIGAEDTDLVICTRSTVWQRCIPMGGNAFTRAIADAFKLNFERAEKLKRTAPMSKYARQILQAMKPVFTDLATEIQRSLGFYNSSNPDAKLSKIIAFGGGTKMGGLLKYLQQILGTPVNRPDSFKKLAINPSVSTAKFHESVCDFGVVYGLALQGLGLARIESNLLPRSIARSMAWTSKAKYFTAAACVLLLVSLLCFARISLDKVNYENKSQHRQEVSNIISDAMLASNKLKAEEGKGAGYETIIKKEFELFKYRDVVPLLHQTILSTLPNEKNNAEQKELYGAFADGDIETVLKIPRKERKQIFITSMSVRFADDIGSTELGSTDFLKVGGIKRKKKSKTGAASFSEEELIRRMFGSHVVAPKYTPKKYTKTSKGTVGKGITAKGEVGEKKAGFVVSIAGYSPYKNIDELMDPIGVGNEQSKWGVVTRLMHLDDIVDGNSPFELYKKTEPAHFKSDTGAVDLDAEMPAGVGVEKTQESKSKIQKEKGSERVLIDPMTKEVISKVAELDKNRRKKLDKSGNVVYKVNDNWFTLDAKFIWKDAPKETIAN